MDDDPIDDFEFDSPNARISVMVGSMSIEVEGEDPDEVEQRFVRTWEKVLSESQEMALAIRDGHPGFR